MPAMPLGRPVAPLGGAGPMPPPPGGVGAGGIGSLLAGLATQHGQPASLTMHPGGGPPSMPMVPPGQPGAVAGAGGPPMGAPGMGPPGMGGPPPGLGAPPVGAPSRAGVPAPKLAPKPPSGIKIKPSPVRTS